MKKRNLKLQVQAENVLKLCLTISKLFFFGQVPTKPNQRTKLDFIKLI